MSRLTFREKTDVCWQKQLRDSFYNESVPNVELDLGKAIVRPVSYNLAKQIILKYEWLGTMAKTKYHYGIFFNDLFCAGVSCIATGAPTGGVNTHMFFGIESYELAVLARGACVHWAPTGTNSKLVSWTCRLLKRDSDCKMIIAYADTDAGKIGTIYQACNWFYIGQGNSTQQFISPFNRVYDQKLPYDLKRRYGRTRSYWTKALKERGWKVQNSNPKHRHCYLLDTQDKMLKRRIDALSQPYPKRAGG